MPSVQSRIAELTADGMDVYPPGLRGMAELGRRRFFRSKKFRRSVGLPGGRGRAIGLKGLSATPPASVTAFLKWVRAEFPSLYAAAERRLAAGNDGAPGMSAVETTATAKPESALTRLVSTITSLAPQYLQYRAQQQLLDVQLDRARQGLPPLRPTDYAPAVQLSVDPSMYSPALETLKPWLIYGGLALGAFFVFRTFGGRRR
jgi:hypothetical protein